MATVITQTNSTLATFPAQFDDPANAKKIAKDRDGFPIGATKIRQARWEEYRETAYDFNNLAVAQTLTADSIIGGCIRLLRANAGFNITLPTADLMSIALASYAPLVGNPTATPAVQPGNNAPGTWRKQIVFRIENASGQTATLVASATITLDAASTTATLATGTSGTYAICSSVDTAGSIAYVLKKL